MYPQNILNELAAAKTQLRQSISRRRAICVAAADGAVQPLRWIDLASNVWRLLAPFAKVAVWPLGAAAAGGILPLPKFFRQLFRWAPPLLTVISTFRRMRRGWPSSAG